MSRRKTNVSVPVLACAIPLILGCFLPAIECQEESAETLDRLSRLIPTNSVYEQPYKSAAGSEASETRLLDENSVLKASAAIKRHEEAEEEVYEDEYVAESDAKLGQGDAKLSRISEAAVDRGISSFPLSTHTEEDSSRDEDYVEDPSTSQYDAYYYYDDYGSNNRSRYKAGGNPEVLDYPDAEERQKERDERQENGRASIKAPDHHPTDSGHDSSRNLQEEEEEEGDQDQVQDQEQDQDQVQDQEQDQDQEKEEEDEKNPDSGEASKAKESSSDEPEEEDPASRVSRTNDEDGTSMEGSDKSFAYAHLPGTKANSSSLGDASILIGEAVVSVVTTKSVVNGTISVPTTPAPTSTEQVAAPPSSTASVEEQAVTAASTEDTSRILASVQTSRSISGARFLPFPVIDRIEPIGQNGEKKSSPAPESTESIIDKLDRVQSELSSGFLTGGFRTAGNALQLDVLNERERASSSNNNNNNNGNSNRRRYTTTGKTPVISKFVPRRYNDKRLDHATPKPRLETTLDSLEGLLPRDYLSRTSSTTSTPSKTGFRWPTKSTTSTSTEASTSAASVQTSTTKRAKAKVVVQDISAFLPAGYKLKQEDADASATESSLLSDILQKSKLDISSFLPADYDKRKNSSSSSDSSEKSGARIATTTTARNEQGVSSTEKSAPEKSIQDLFAKSKFDISALLPPGYEQKKETPAKSEDEDAPDSSGSNSSAPDSATAKKSAGPKIVFPSRPGGRKPVHKVTTPAGPRGDGPASVTPRIQKGWPTRATTEFTGWPTPSTTSISIEKLLEAARTATVSSASLIPITQVTTSTTTTTTTTTTPRPTTPGVCEDECEVAGTIKIIGNTSWVPELLDRNTHEWQNLANEIEQEMNFIFSKSAVLAKWYKKIRIDSFSEGSILVDYFIELADMEQRVNTQELKVIFHDSLRTYNANRWNGTKAKGPIKLGSFMIDPKYTDFVVIPKATTPQYIEKDDRLVPQWAIAVIVIGVGGLVFIIIFGVSVLINRHNAAKLKPSISTIYEEEIIKNTHRPGEYSKPVHTIWTDPDVSWNDKSFESTSNKVLVEKSFQDNKKYNMYDSWRSEWNGYYYNNGSHTSSKYGGYDSTTNLSNRHQPDYDTNF